MKFLKSDRPPTNRPKEKKVTTTLSRLTRQYPALPPAIVMKTALLSIGVHFDPLMVEAARTALPDFRPHTLPDGSKVQVPYLMKLENGSLVRLRCSEESPFTIKHQGGLSFLLLDEGAPFIQFSFANRPVWHDQTASDGTPLNACGLNQHGDMMVLNLTPACEYWSTPRNESNLSDIRNKRSYRCAFCGYGLPDERSRALGQKEGEATIPPLSMKHAAEAVSKGIEAGARHLYLTGGSMLDPELEADRYLSIVSGLRDVAKDVYLAVGSQALPPSRLKELKAAGADGVCFNLEVWDRKVWQYVCPGKSKFFTRDMWENSLVEAVSVFGKTNVHTAFVIGAEMVFDNALKDTETALRSNLEGARWLLSRDIHPILSLFWPFVGTDMEGAAGPDLHFLLRLFSGVHELRLELNKPFPGNLACKRCLYMQVEGDFE
mgnify:CR=1 FL=1